jgi:hypothetical protein
MTGKKTSESKAQSQPSQFRRQARNTHHLASGIKNNINRTLHGVGRFYLLTLFFLFKQAFSNIV